MGTEAPSTHMMTNLTLILFPTRFLFYRNFRVGHREKKSYSDEFYEVAFIFQVGQEEYGSDVKTFYQCNIFLLLSLF